MEQGVYEQIINHKIQMNLEEYKNLKHILVKTEYIDKGEASMILAKYLSGVVQSGLNMLKDQKVKNKIRVINKLIDILKQETQDEFFEDMKVSELEEILYLLLDKRNTVLAFDDSQEKIEKIVPRPESSLAVSSLFTGSEDEPKLGEELKREIASADRIDMLVSFLRWSGVRIIYPALKEFADRGGKLRILTTSYMSATDIKAVEELAKIPDAEIKISYDTKHTRHHAKSYIFYRKTGFSTAYIGSSNLSRAALNEGLEWNVKITQEDMPEMMEKVKATFEGYWNSSSFSLYTKEDYETLRIALEREKKDDDGNPYIFDIRPYPFQQEILDKLDAERKLHKHYKNLVVAATGTGKTVIAALDFRRYLKENPEGKLLFVAHREEILKQSLETFRGVLKDPNFGELYVGNYKPSALDHLFISIQTLQSSAFTKKLSPNYYDFIVVDEFHHAAADSYQNLLTHFTPNILLGLTATPERMDGKSVFKYFDDRIAAEIRLPEAIQKGLLSPFQYFGVTDTVNLKNVSWRSGGYDAEELTDHYVRNKKEAEQRADAIIQAIYRYVTDINDVKGLGFCVTVEHAEFMNEYFNDSNIPSMVLSSKTDKKERIYAKQRLNSGEIKFIFVVDLYNEGVDIPDVNTILFLRPTESLTVFLQQLGRGLRLAEGKECLTVLDFIGQAHKKYNFANKFKALLTKNRRSMEKEIKNGFTALPAGCYIQLERQAEEYVLENIRKNINRASVLREHIENFEEDSGEVLNLKNFLDYYNIEPRNIYNGKRNFSRLCAEAGVKYGFKDSLEEEMNKAFPRLQSIDSHVLIEFYLSKLHGRKTFNSDDFSEKEQRMINILYTSIWGQTIENWDDPSVIKNMEELLDNNPVLLQELKELLEYNYEKLDVIGHELELNQKYPLTLHSHFTRDQLLVGLDYMKPQFLREGIRYFEDLNTYVLLVTLHKSEKDYSPTTMYQDYVVSEKYFHWQSQNNTAIKSPTGQRLIHHKENGTTVLLFVRDYKIDPVSKKTAPYTFLGPVNYVKHEGERPINILWKLEYPIPGKYMNQFAIVG